MKASNDIWLLLLLLLLQALIATVRAVLTHSRWEWRAGEEGTLDLEASRPDITRLSSALDFALLLTTGVYFLRGVHLVQTLTALVTDPAWLTPALNGAGYLALTWLVLSLGRLAPEALGHTWASDQQEKASSITQFVHTLLQPFSATALAFADLLAQWLGGRPLRRTAIVTEEEIQTLVTAGEKEGVIEEGAGEMITSIFRLDDMITREVMRPRIDVLAVDVDSDPDEVLERVIASGHSRIPVYDETIDNVIGLLYTKDLLRYQAESEEMPSLREILRPAHFVPEAKRLDSLLKEMQAKKIQLAVVVDEYGGVAGLVTLEDVVEEIVGEIQDEYDREEPEVIKKEKDVYLFDTRIPLDDVQELLAIPLPLEEIDSLGGFIYNKLGHIPDVGESLTYEDVTFEVVEITGRRIRKVQATKHKDLVRQKEEDDVQDKD